MGTHPLAGTPYSRIVRLRSAEISVAYQKASGLDDLAGWLARELPVITFVQMRELPHWQGHWSQHDDWLILRPLGGTDREIAGIHLPLEGNDVQPAAFDLPDPSPPSVGSGQGPGDFRSCRLLRDAVRLGFRSSAGPFRSFARLAVEPRPYQLVPLLMALRLDPVLLSSPASSIIQKF